MPSLVGLGVWDGAAGDNGFVVSKHDWPANRDTEAVQWQMEINDLISGSSGGHELGTMRGGFDRVLLFAAEINDGLIDSMDNAGDGSAGDEVMVEVGVHPRGGDDGVTQRCRSIVGHLFMDVAMGCPMC